MATQLLVSVRSAAEAQAALAGGADFIDIKEPRHGSLGRPEDRVVREVVSSLGVARPISMALGELRDRPPAPTVRGVHWLKVGLAGLGPGEWIEPFLNLAEAVLPAPLVPVLYADAERAETASPLLYFHELAALQLRYVLIDTFQKDGRGLLQWLPLEDLSGLVEASAAAELQLGLAGSLDEYAIRVLLPLNPALIAVRGAACGAGDRQGTVTEERVRKLKVLLG